MVRRKKEKRSDWQIARKYMVEVLLMITDYIFDRDEEEKRIEQERTEATNETDVS